MAISQFADHPLTTIHWPLLYSDSVLPETSSVRSLFLTGLAGRL